MKTRNDKQLTTSLLIMYMISALLFLMTIELHIHAHSDNASVDGGSPVHISSIADKITSTDNSDEINISPGGALKLTQNSFGMFAVILLATLISLFCYFSCFTRLRDIQTRLPQLPFHGTPTLRGPPAFSS